MGFAILIAGLALFIGPHVFVTRRDARARVIARIGAMPYRGVFSLVAIAGFVLICIGFSRYRADGWIDVWNPPAWTRYVAIVLVWFAFVCAVAAYIPGGIKRRLKHPLLVAVKLWAVAHLISNGDLGGMVLFGAILAWAVYDRISLKSRNEPEIPPIVAYNRANDLIAVLIGTIIFLAFGYVFHPLWIGVPVFGTPALGT